MHVIAACDDRFVPHAAACLLSIAENGGADLHLRLIDDGISAENATKLDVLFAQVDFHRIPAEQALTRDLQGRGNVSKATYLRLCIPELLPKKVERALYIDVDTLVLEDLRPLAEQEFAGAWTMAVRDIGYEGKYLDHKCGLGLPKDAPCFNAGVLLIDLVAWRREQVGARARQFIGEHAKAARMMDQDGLNVICHGHWSELSPCWNMMHRFYRKPCRQYFDYDRKAWQKMLAQPGIVHFSSCHKPDHLLGRHPLASRYWNYRNASPWPLQRLVGDTWGNRCRLLVDACKQWFRRPADA
jgi:lipopolysaccharide biosynthesis glycosyltransferase